MENKQEESSVEDEIMVLESIYEDQLTLIRNSRDKITNIQMTLYPATANDQDSQFVKLLLDIFIPNKYPGSPLEVKFKSSRGLSDELLQNLKTGIDKLMANMIGDSMLFDVIEFIKENLTANNIPSCPCPICLLAFRELDDFLKTDCFHYFHSYCLYQYITHLMKNQDTNPSTKTNNSKNKADDIACPVCRVVISFNYSDLKNSPKPLLDNEPALVDLTHWNKEKVKRQETFERQKNKGGIIDLDVEKNKNLLSTIEQAYLGSLNSTPADDISNSRDVIINDVTDCNDDVIDNDIGTQNNQTSKNNNVIVGISPVKPKNKPHYYGRKYNPRYRGRGRGGNHLTPQGHNSSPNLSSSSHKSGQESASNHEQNQQDFSTEFKPKGPKKIFSSGPARPNINTKKEATFKDKVENILFKPNSDGSKIKEKFTPHPSNHNGKYAAQKHHFSNQNPNNKAKYYRPKSSNLYQKPKHDNNSRQTRQFNKNKLTEKPAIPKESKSQNL